MSEIAARQALREAQRLLRQARRAAKQCIECGQPSGSKARCPKHLEAANRRADRLRRSA